MEKVLKPNSCDYGLTRTTKDSFGVVKHSSDEILF